MKHWILLTKEHSEAVWIVPEGDQYAYEVAPKDDLKKGDVVYLWSNPANSFYGWGEVAETPQIIKVLRQRGNDIEEVRRHSVIVNRIAEFRPPINEHMLRSDKNLKKLIPKGFDDLLALYLRPGLANYLNDFIREHKLDAPHGSATVSWIAQESAPQVDLNAELIIQGDKTNEGRLVVGVRIAWFEIIRRFSQNPEDIFKIDPRRFEELIAGAYEREGYLVELTPHSNDKGRDVVATRPGIGSIRIFDQVKRYKISRPVTAEEVRALVGVITMAGNVSKGVLTTTSEFAPTLLDDPDIKRLVPHRLELKPREMLLRWLGIASCKK